MFTPLDNMGKVTLMMDLITQRQRALGSNLANVDTPGYVRRDINFGDYLNSMNSPLETKLSTERYLKGTRREYSKVQVLLQTEKLLKKRAKKLFLPALIWESGYTLM